MYWVRLHRLKNELIEGRVSEHQAFPYFLAVLIVDAILINSSLAFPGGDFTPDVISLAQIIIPVAIIVIATLLLYHTNGSTEGRSFFVRYFSLVWVVGIRFMPFAAAILGAWFYFVFFEAGEYEPGWQAIALWSSIYGLYYWRVWVHFRDVRARALAT